MEYKCYGIEKTPIGVNTSKLSLTQSIKEDIKLSKSPIEESIEIKDSLRWENFNNINNNSNSFAKCENKTGIPYKTSPLILAFKNFNIDDSDEIQDVNLRLKLQSNVDLNSKISLNLNGTSALTDTKKTEIGYPKKNKNISSVKGNKKWCDLYASLNHQNAKKEPYQDYSLEKYQAIILLDNLNNINNITNENQWLSELNRIIRETEKILKEKINRKNVTYNEIISDLDNKLNLYIQNSKMYWYVYNDKESQYINSMFEVVENGDIPFLKNNHWNFHVDAEEIDPITKESSIICRKNIGTYIVNDYKKASSSWIEYSDFGFDITGTIEDIEFEIEGNNYSSNNMTAVIQGICNDKKTGVFQIGNIEVGGFNKKIKLDRIFSASEINSENFSVRISFNELDSASLIELYKVNLKINYSSSKRVIKNFNEVNDVEILSNPITKWYLIKDLKGLDLISGKDLKNTVLTFIDFGRLQNNEYIKFYSAELIVHYKNRKGNSVSKSVLSPQYQIKTNCDEYGENCEYVTVNSKLININSSVNKIGNPVAFTGVVKNNEVAIEQNQSEMLHKDPVGLTLKHQVFQMFEANSSKISAIEFGVAGLNGAPSKYLFLEILENSSQNRPSKSIYKRTVEGWVISNTDNVRYDVNVNNLSVGGKYWIKLSVPVYDKNNFYKLQYKENVAVFNNSLIQKENNNEILVNSGIASLKFKIYRPNNLRTFTKNSISSNVDKLNVNVENNFLRKNSSSNVELKSLSLRYGDYDGEV